MKFIHESGRTIDFEDSLDMTRTMEREGFKPVKEVKEVKPEEPEEIEEEEPKENPLKVNKKPKR